MGCSALLFNTATSPIESATLFKQWLPNLGGFGSKSTRFEKVRMFCNPVNRSQLFGSKVSSVCQNWTDIIFVVFCQLFLAAVGMYGKYQSRKNCKVKKRGKYLKVVFCSVISWCEAGFPDNNPTAAAHTSIEKLVLVSYLCICICFVFVYLCICICVFVLACCY